MAEQDPNPRNQETDPRYNREPGIVIVPGSFEQQTLARFEGRHSKYTSEQFGPGNPWRKGNDYNRAGAEYPKMLYRAQHWNGKVCCMAAPPDPLSYTDHREYERNVQLAEKFTNECQRIVHSEDEHQRAREDNWRDHPDEAVAVLFAKDRGEGTADAEREYSDRNMGERARREVERVKAESGGEHLPEMPRTPVAPKGWTPEKRSAAKQKAAATRAAKKAAKEPAA